MTTMKTMKQVAVLACFLCVLLLNLNGVEARRHRDDRDRERKNYKLFVFGDSFVDIGNRKATAQRVESSREWYAPYGMSDSRHGYRPSGRFSDGLVQSDFLAKILGRDESPPAFRVWNDEDDSRRFAGVNFAVSESSVFNRNSSREVPSLSMQIDQLKDNVDEEDLEDSVALVAVSVLYDYQYLTHWTNDDDVRDFADDVTDKIVEGVRRLQKLGVSKVLVDTVPPFGCTPWRSWQNGYRSCDSRGNVVSSAHNAALKDKLADLDDVLVLDLEAVFQSSSRQFRARFSPCCDTPADPQNGFCGQVDPTTGTQQYTLCRNPEDYFYWDSWHPTQAAWEAVMENLEDPIKDFLQI